MSYNRKLYSTEPKKSRSRRRDEHARINVISLRLSNQEKRILDGITKSSSKNVSDVVREAIEFWLQSTKGSVSTSDAAGEWEIVAKDALLRNAEGNQPRSN